MNARGKWCKGWQMGTHSTEMIARLRLTSHHLKFFFFLSTSSTRTSFYQQEMKIMHEEEDIKLSFRDGISDFAYVVSPPPPPSLSTRRPASPDAAAAARPQNRAQSKSMSHSSSSPGALDGDRAGAEDNVDTDSSRGRPGPPAPVRSTAPARPNRRTSTRLEERRLKKASARSQKRSKKGYAAPEVYAHLSGVPDHVAEELDGMASSYCFVRVLTLLVVLFCGIKCVGCCLVF